MGFILTVLYIVATILSPEQLGSAAAGYHPLLFLAGATFLASLPEILNGARWISPVQTPLLLAFVAAITLSGIANGWLGGILISWQEFVPSAAVFFFIVLSANSVRRLRILTAAPVCACVALAVEALCGYYRGYRGDLFVLQQNVALGDGGIGQLARLRGAGFLNDPNDFAQILLIVLPLLFLAWQAGRVAVNFFLVLVPAAVLLWAVYLTHSRGALVALSAIAWLGLRRKIGSAASLVLIVALFAVLVGLAFTGGRGISAADGADRLAAWASGLEMFKSAPLLGVGFGRFTDLNDITAHNSFVLCLAELGLVGSTLWMALLVTTLLGLNQRTAGAPVEPAEYEAEESEPEEREAGEVFSAAVAGQADAGNFRELESNSQDSRAVESGEIAMAGETELDLESESLRIPARRWAIALRMSLVAFLITGWFLSRSYRMPMYLALGLATATLTLAPSGERARPGRWIWFSLGAEAAAILCVYGMVRL